MLASCRATHAGARGKVLLCAFAAVLCAGCVGTGTTGKITPPPLPAPKSSATPSARFGGDVFDAEGALKLKPEAQQKAEALAHYAAGTLYELRREPDTAIAEYQKALQIDPANADLATKVGAELLRRKQTDKALPILERAAAANPKKYELQMLLAIAYQTADQKEKAFAANLKANELDPIQLSPYQSLVGYYLKQKKIPDALKLLERGFQQKTDDARFWVMLGELYALTLKAPDADKAAAAALPRKLKTPRAEECYQRAQKLAGDDLTVTLRMADYYVAHDQIDKGIALYKLITEKRPDALDVRERLAYAYAAKKDLNSAIAQFEELVKRQPLNWQVYFFLANFYEENKAPERAQANYEQALILNPKELQVYLRLTRLHLSQKHPDEATKVLERAKERFPDSARIPYFRGLIASNMKDYAKAVDSFAHAESTAKTQESDKDLLDSTFYFYYGAACERGGQFDRAVELFRQSIKLNPENDEALNYLGYMFADKGTNLKEAEDLVKQALKMQPKSGAFLDSLGWIYYRTGRYQEALKCVAEAAQSDAAKEDATVFSHLADIYLKLGKKTQAIEQLRKGLEVEPANKEVAEKLKQLGGTPSAKPNKK